MQVRTVQRHQIGGWGFSLILHGILLSAIIPSFRHIPTPIQLAPFQWNVTFVESLQQTSPLEPDRYASAPEESLRTSKTKSHNSVSSPTSPLKPSHHIRKGSTHVVEESGSREPLLAAQPPTPIAQLRPEISSPTPSATQTTSIPQETLAGEQPNTNGTAGPVSRESPAQPETSIDQAIQSPPASAAAETAMAPAPPMDTPSIPSPPVSSTASERPSLPQTDFSWLQHAVSRRLEELKRLSRPSLDDSRKFKVLVKAVVSNTGELIEVEVVKSSGLNRIDQEAMTLVQRAFPMPLDHPLERQQIAMRIPITYSRD
jgi:TonB family protein